METIKTMLGAKYGMLLFFQHLNDLQFNLQ